MAEMEIGTSDTGPGGIPKKYLIIGAGAAALALFFIMQRGKSGGTTDPNAAPNTLGPNASLALGSLENSTRQQIGDLEQLFSGQLGDLSTHLDTQAAALSDQYGTLSTQVGGGFNSLSDSLAAAKAGILAGQAGLGAQIGGVGGQIGRGFDTLNQSVWSSYSGLVAQNEADRQSLATGQGNLWQQLSYWFQSMNNPGFIIGGPSDPFVSHAENVTQQAIA